LQAEKKKLQQQLLVATKKAIADPHHQRGPGSSLEESITQLLSFIVDESTLKSFGWPNQSVQQVLEAVIRRCGHQAVSSDDCVEPEERLRCNVKLLFTVVINDDTVQKLLDTMSVDQVIQHILDLASA